MLSSVLFASKSQASEHLHECHRSGEDHRSLPAVLEQLQAQLKGEQQPLAPGQSQAKPLHVVLHVSMVF